jgi:hypothetical protein
MNRKTSHLPERRWLSVCLLALVAPAGTALAGAGCLTDLGPAPGVLADYLSTTSSVRGASSRTALNTIVEGPSGTIVVPGAANAPGKNGAYFHTDLYLAGSGTGTGNIVFDLSVLPAGVDNTNNQAHRFSMPDNGFDVITDVVASFGVSGAATIMIQTNLALSTSSGAFALLSAWGRTYTAGPSGGSYSTTLPAIKGYLVSASQYSETPGVIVSAAKRTNVGCFNNTSSPATCLATVYGSDGTNLGTISLPLQPLSSAQQGLTSFSIPEPGGKVVFSVTSGYVTGYVAVDDNVTNDADLFLGSSRSYINCVNVAGNWNAAYSTACSGGVTGVVAVTQTGCSFSAVLPGKYGGTVIGTIFANIGDFTLTFNSCGGSGSGTATFDSSSGSITGTFAGSATGSGCCGYIAGAFVLNH